MLNGEKRCEIWTLPTVAAISGSMHPERRLDGIEAGAVDLRKDPQHQTDQQAADSRLEPLGKPPLGEADPRTPSTCRKRPNAVLAG